jgi:Flp pilus assembly protein TadB
MPQGDDDRSLIDGRPTAGAQSPRRALVALLIGAILVMIVIAALTLH